MTLAEFAEGFEDYAGVDAFCSRFTVVQLSRAIAHRCAELQRRLARRLGENGAE